jgi:hypothetical protein
MPAVTPEVEWREAGLGDDNDDILGLFSARRTSTVFTW